MSLFSGVNCEGSARALVTCQGPPAEQAPRRAIPPGCIPSIPQTVQVQGWSGEWMEGPL